MGVFILQIDRIKKISLGITLFLILVLITTATIVYGADTPGIDDDTVITVGQAGSLAPSVGDYGWDSRGAVFTYYTRNGKVTGSLGTILFCDRNGTRRPFLWDEWGMEFPDWWGKMLAERIRNEAGDDKIPFIREAFSEYVTFECEWMIAIGTKSKSAGGKLYKTLRTDGTLRVMNTADLNDGTPEEELFVGDDMADSLSSILKGEEWGEGSQQSFAQRNPYYYDVRIRSFDVDIRATNCAVCAAKGCKSGSMECTHVPAGTFINIPVPIVYNGMSYSGAKSFVWEGQTVSYFEPEIAGYQRKKAADDLSGLNGTISGNSITPTGNTRIILGYEAVEPVEVLNDLTVKYVILKESGNSVKDTVKEVQLKNALAKGSVFSISLSKSINVQGEEYGLIPGAETALSYAANHKYANALKGLNSYRITASAVKDGKITYSTGVPYDHDRPGLLYVPVAEIGSGEGGGGEEPEYPIEDGDTPSEGDSGVETHYGEGATGSDPGSGSPGTGLVQTFSDPSAVIEIKSEKFDVSSAIPSTESVYVRAEFADYLYSLDASVISGSFPVNVTVNFPYERRWTETDEEGNVEEKSDYGTNSTTVTVYRPYSFIRLNSFAYYVPDSIRLTNQALSPKEITITAAQAGVRSPSCSSPVTYGGSRIGGNIEYPQGYPFVINASLTTVDGGEEMPAIPRIDTARAGSLAEAAVPQMRCRNDEIVFNGRSILGASGWHIYSGAATADTTALAPSRTIIDSRTVLGRDHISIPADIRNGVYPSTVRIVTYRPEVLYGGGSVAYNPVTSVNSIVVHTPVLCELQISECNRYVPNSRFDQSPGGADDLCFRAIVGSSLSYGLEGHENDSCDFMLYVNNAGEHPVYSGRLGRGYDYLSNVSGLNGGRYVLKNEVYFPFDVYLDVLNDYNTSNDRLLSGGNWYETGAAQRYYLPDWVDEGEYCIEARTRAVNSLSRSDMISTSQKNGLKYLYANSDRSDYVTADSFRIRVSGKMYGFRLTDISSTAEWTDVFELGGVSKMGLPGIKDGTLTSALPGGKTSHAGLPDYYFYYSAGTRNELGLISGRNNRFIMPMLAGCSPDASKQNSGMMKSGYLWNFEFYTTGKRLAAEKSYAVIEPRFRWISTDGKQSGDYENTKVYYSETDDNGLKYNKEFRQIIRLGDHSEPVNGNKLLQLWRFKYSLPSKYTVKVDDKLCRDGYLIVNFKITVYDTSGKAAMSYNAAEENGYCNMWAIEDQQLSRTDFYRKTFTFRYGDIIILDITESKGDDFQTDRRY